ncbi:hypothetical protein [Ammoniphilus sp. YIM 78166]|nr:hypothetical protein [Ammoniphilus sp. YIM 78166]
MTAEVEDKCIRCEEVLVIWERNRSECWNCSKLAVVTHYDPDGE